MAYATVSSKGQITLPVESRRALDIKPHDRVLVELQGDRIVVRAAPDLLELEGFLGKALSAREEKRRKKAALTRRARRRT